MMQMEKSTVFNLKHSLTLCCPSPKSNLCSIADAQTGARVFIFNNKHTDMVSLS